MPAARPVLDLPAARRLAAAAFEPAGPDGFGLELEWLLRRADGTTPDADDHAALVEAASAPLPAGGRVTFEPGGQLELSSAVTSSLPVLLDAVAADAAVLHARARALGAVPVGLGLDPTGGHRRVRSARYDAMAAYFGARGPTTARLGHLMMCATAALQVNVGLPADGEGAARWAAAHRLGPSLAATFANSPLLGAGPSGWASTRLAVWHGLDPARTAPVQEPGSERSAAAAWADYALAAPVMLVRAGDRHVPVRDLLPFRAWLRSGHRLGFPTSDDLAYHLTTLFPPVRPRGWLELRVLDALDEPHWKVAAAVAVVLLTHPGARRDALAAAGPAGASVTRSEAARLGLRSPTLARAAIRVLAVARDALVDLGAGGIADAVADWSDRYVTRGRSPADDVLDAWRERPDRWPTGTAPTGRPRVRTRR